MMNHEIQAEPPERQRDEIQSELPSRRHHPAGEDNPFNKASTKLGAFGLSFALLGGIVGYYVAAMSPGWSNSALRVSVLTGLICGGVVGALANKCIGPHKWARLLRSITRVLLLAGLAAMFIIMLGSADEVARELWPAARPSTFPLRYETWVVASVVLGCCVAAVGLVWVVASSYHNRDL
jgi:hypothetical protein